MPISSNNLPVLQHTWTLHLCKSTVLLLCPPKARPLYFTTVIYFFYFISIDKRPAIESHPNLADRLKVVSIYKCPTQISGPSSQN